MKKTLSLLLIIICIILSFVAIHTTAIFAETYEYYTYEILEEEKIVKITDCNNTVSGTVIVPETIDGYPVSIIEAHAFADCENIEDIILPNTLTAIGAWAFQHCDSLTNLTIPQNVTWIGQGIFNGCISLKSVVIPDGITYISDDMFAYCKKITEFEINDNIVSIGKCAFEGTGLTAITIPKSVNFIGQDAFKKSKLKGIGGLETIYYEGTEAEWNNIVIEDTSSNFTSANVISENTAGENDKSEETFLAQEYETSEIVKNDNKSNVETNGYIQTEIHNKTPLSVGDDYSVAIKTDGTLWLWGNNYEGTDSSDDYTAKPQKILNSVISVDISNSHNAAIKKDGSLWLWGNNSDGQLGNGSNSSVNTPIKTMENVVSVSLGNSHSAAIKSDGSLWLWGNNSDGQLGNGSNNSVNTPIKIMENVVSVSLGNSHSAAIKSDGSLWLWGNNVRGQLGNGTNVDKILPIKTMDNVSAVSLGNNHSGAIKNDGTLWMWGANEWGQVGISVKSKSEETYTPKKIMNDVSYVSLGEDHSAVVKNDGSLWKWGFRSTYKTYYIDDFPNQVMDGIMLYDRNFADIPQNNNYSNEKFTDLPQNLEMDFYGEEKLISVDVPNAKFEIEDKKIAKLKKSIRVLNVGQKEQTSSDFKIIPLSPGNTTITVSTSDGRKAVCNFTVTGAKIVLNGEQLSFDQPPINTNGRLLVPIRKISESMGRSVYWNQEMQTALIDNETNALIVPLYSDTLYKAYEHAFESWEQVSLDVPALMSNDRILVPIRAICENLDANVEWDSKYSTAYITFDDTVTKNLMSDSLFDSINLIYYLNSFSLTEFEKCSEDLNYFYDNRNHSIDAMTMGFSDPWAGIKDIASMISGSDNATNIIRQCLYDILAEISENQKSSSFEIVKAINDTVSTGIDIYSETGGLDVNLRVANKHLDTFDYYLRHEYKSKYKDTADSLINIGIFTAEELSYIFTEYTTNLEYLDIFRESLADAGYSDETLENAFSQLEYEYTDKFVGVLVHLRDALAEDGFSKALSTVIGDGSFGLGNAVWNVWFNAIGVTKKGEALKTFYGIYCFDDAVNRALTSKAIVVKTSEQKEISKLKSLIQFVKAEKIAAYNAMKVIDNDKKSDLYIDECISKIQNWSYYIWER